MMVGDGGVAREHGDEEDEEDPLVVDVEGEVEVGEHAEDHEGGEVGHLSEELNERGDEGARAVKGPGEGDKDMSWRSGCTACSAP